MKIKSIKLKDFKRFTDLSIEGLPETAKLVVMIGPNGCGKSSVFDALKLKDFLPNPAGPEMILDDLYQLKEYYFKSGKGRHRYSYYGSLNQTPNERRGSYYSATTINPLYPLDHDLIVKFHDKELTVNREKIVHVRSAYRNYSVTQPPVVSRHDPLQQYQLVRLIENDETLGLNCRYLASRWLERSSEIGESDENLTDLQNEILGELRDAMRRLFTDPPLVLRSLGHPTDGDLFEFDKGTSEMFTYQNLASGEKAALDLLLDVIVTKTEDDEMIICIDEPEAHIHTKLQGPLLEELYNLIPDNSQLWIATHSIGMVRKAQELRRENKDSVVFLDFGKNKAGEAGEDRDFDGQETIEPAEPNPNFWAQTYDIALGDLAELVSPQRIVLCESKAQDPTKGFDAACYNQIFGGRYPDTRFISIGGREDVKKTDTHLIPVIEAIVGGAEILRLRDGDDAIDQEIEEDAKKGIRTLSRRNIEGYLLDDEVLTELCNREGKPDKIQDLLKAKQDALQKSIAESKDHDDLKPTAQGIHVAAKNALKPSKMGNKSRSFMRDILAPLIQPGMKVYEQLEKDIFGE